MIYDIIVLGGGIAGLNTVYEISKRFPSKTVLLVEKTGNLGGKVETYSDKYMTVEAGAGRFSKTHHLVFKLIHELGLGSKITEITGSAVYAPVDKSLPDRKGFQDSLFDAPMDLTNASVFDAYFTSGLDAVLGSSKLPNAGLIAKVILASKSESPETLRNTTFLEYCSKILSESQVQYIVDSFGYYSELVVMNAHDCIQVIMSLSPWNKFYGLRGGLSQLIDGISKRIRKNKNVRVLLDHEVKKIGYLDGLCIVDCDRGRHIGKKCVCALPVRVLESIGFFKPLSPILKRIKSPPLCRIYSKFSPGVDGKVWFDGLPKLTTNNNLRMVIPIDKSSGLIMVSYSDNKFADFWQKLYKKKGVAGVDAEIARLMKQTTGLDIPKPIETRVFYWDSGVGYWGLGVNSDSVARRLVQPFDDVPVYICGEPFSAESQQWMEGALETSWRVLDRIF
jgi:hypothetical protein